MLTTEELQKIIDQFNEEELKRQGLFGISQYGGGSDESFIRANKEGLELFALELLKASIKIENVVSDPYKKNIPFEYDVDWIDENSDTFIQYIEPIPREQNIKLKSDYKTTLIDKLMPIGCGLLVIIVVIFVVVGLITVFKWLF